jgi:hypothetical protein
MKTLCNAMQYMGVNTTKSNLTRERFLNSLCGIDHLGSQAFAERAMVTLKFHNPYLIVVFGLG